MKNRLLTIILLLLSLHSFGQKDSVFIVKDDWSPVLTPLKHVWVGIKNQIGIPVVCRENVRDIKSDNGRIEIIQKENDSREYYLIPEKPGIVHITVKMVCESVQKTDSILSLLSTFTAINPPDVRVEINKNLIKSKKKISISIIDNTTGKEVSSSLYQLGGLGETTFFLSPDRKMLGTMEFFTSSQEQYSKFIQKGNIIQCPPLPIRDMKTGLLWFSPAFEFVINF
ncbi:MAG: hypothetical protein V2A54_10500 [Bacteroidota bacterium]